MRAIDGQVRESPGERDVSEEIAPAAMRGADQSAKASLRQLEEHAIAAAPTPGRQGPERPRRLTAMKEQIRDGPRADPTMLESVSSPPNSATSIGWGRPPVLLEDQIGENTRNDCKRDQHENDCPPRYEEWLTRARELQDQRQPGRR